MWLGVIAAAIAVLLFLGLQDIDLPFVSTALLDTLRGTVRRAWNNPQQRVGFGVIAGIVVLFWFLSRRTNLR